MGSGGSGDDEVELGRLRADGGGTSRTSGIGGGGTS